MNKPLKTFRHEQFAFALALNNFRTGQTLEAQFFLPKTKRYRGKTKDQNYTYWICRFVTKKNGKIKDYSASGDSWIQALLMAIEGVRRMIPESQEGDWQTDDELPSWVIFPKHVTIGWGYDFHRKLWDMIRLEEKRLNESIARKRRKATGNN